MCKKLKLSKQAADQWVRRLIEVQEQQNWETWFCVECQSWHVRKISHVPMGGGKV